VVADVVSDSARVHGFEESEAGDLVQVLSSLIDDTLHLLGLETVGT
jgi:hypothetical protein